MVLSWITGCQADCVQRCHLDPVEQDLKRWKEQRAALAKDRRRLMERVREFEGKVFVNQKAALDLLKDDLTSRCEKFVGRLKAVRVKTTTVGRVHRRELRGFSRLTDSYRILQKAFEGEDPSD